MTVGTANTRIAHPGVSNYAFVVRERHFYLAPQTVGLGSQRLWRGGASKNLNRLGNNVRQIRMIDAGLLSVGTREIRFHCVILGLLLEERHRLSNPATPAKVVITFVVVTVRNSIVSAVKVLNCQTNVL